MQIGVTSLLAAGLGAIALVWASVDGWTQGKPFAAYFEAPESYQFEPPKAGSYQINRLKAAPDGEVLDIHGDAHQLSDLLEGKYTLVSFVYLNCGDVNGCPLAMATLFDIHDTSLQLPQLKDHVQLMTISFDPDRDTVEAIESFAYPISIDQNAAKKLDWHVLTTAGHEDLEPVLKGFGQAIDRSPDQYIINHLLRMYLVDRHGDIRNVYGLGFLDPRLLMTDIETLLLQEQSL